MLVFLPKFEFIQISRLKHRSTKKTKKQKQLIDHLIFGQPDQSNSSNSSKSRKPTQTRDCHFIQSTKLS